MATDNPLHETRAGQPESRVPVTDEHWSVVRSEALDLSKSFREGSGEGALFGIAAGGAATPEGIAIFLEVNSPEVVDQLRENVRLLEEIGLLQKLPDGRYDLAD